ncbi:MAG: hypothetical protein GYA51_08135 [Candidatus Methanofastidiosa archaeon]|nr:hypothetical protein [Candidatus Methanofastidiosa archaeon]
MMKYFKKVLFTISFNLLLTISTLSFISSFSNDVYNLDISFWPEEPKIGEVLIITIKVQNNNDIDVKNVSLECYIHGELIDSFKINEINKNSSYEHSFEWIVDKEDFKISAIVWPDNNSAERISQSKLYFSGYSWYVKNSPESRKGPSFNYWSDSDENVWVDEKGLHLRIVEKEGKWYCSEIYSEDSFGYGKYIFYLDGRPDLFDKNVVLGLFTYYENLDVPSDNIEIDIEFSKWGSSLPNFLTRNTQYVVYPIKKNTLYRYKMILNGDYSTHYYHWKKDSILFRSIHGHNVYNNDIRFIISDKNFFGRNFPVPNNNEKVHINLWLYDSNQDNEGDLPSNGEETEIIIKKFKFE